MAGKIIADIIESASSQISLNVGDTTILTASSTGFQFNSGYGSVATAYGCRAWVNFNGTSTVAIRASGNVTSITDNGTGDYTVNFTTAMPDANYSAVAISHTTVTVINTNYSGVAGSIRWACTNYSGTLTDSSIVNVAMFR